MEQAAGDMTRCGCIVVVVVVVVVVIVVSAAAAVAFVTACHSTAPSPTAIVGAAFKVSESKWLILAILYRRQLAHS
jgi:flagellar basal body-associated protein FliL